MVFTCPCASSTEEILLKKPAMYLVIPLDNFSPEIGENLLYISCSIGLLNAPTWTL